MINPYRLRAFLQDEIGYWQVRADRGAWSERLGALCRIAEVQRVLSAMDAGLFEAEVVG